MNKPFFIIKENLQKTSQTGRKFSDDVTPTILRDICIKITGLSDFDYSYVNNNYHDQYLDPTYNKGRMAILIYNEVVHYISFSEKEIGGRNSSVQSVPTAFNIFYESNAKNKRLHYYFLNFTGNAETEYQMLIYRLMATVGFNFLNAESALTQKIIPFGSIDDIIYNRKTNAERNKSNNSTYITKNEHGLYEIYGKTYGANKYETSLMCYAASSLISINQHIELFEVIEGDLKELPQSSLNVIKKMGKIKVTPTDLTLEKTIFDGKSKLRSPRYTFNLLEKLGNKHCSLCNCCVPELIQGAHIWPVSEIKKAGGISIEDKIKCATDGDNGIWLCENHHKLFDENFITFNNTGRVVINDNISIENLRFIDEITTLKQLPKYIINDKFLQYLQRRIEAS